MLRRTTAVIVALALAGLITGPVDAKKKKKRAKPTTIIYQMNWQGDCAGGGFISLETTPNPDSCALFFPGLGSTYSFPAIEGTGFKLNAKKTITVDFRLSDVVNVVPEFEAVLDGTVGGKDVTIASATQQVTAPTQAAVHFDLEPDKKLDKEKVSSLVLTITWTDGATYSSIDFDSGAPVVIKGYK